MDIPKDIIKCPWCGKEFERKKSAQKFCCEECRKAAKKQTMKQNHKVYKSLKLVECGWCSLFFESKNGEEYCCAECRKKAENRKKKREKQAKNKLDLSQINELARAEGLNYGQYVAKYGL